MEDNRKSQGSLASTWEGRMRQVADCAFSYDRALQIALDCVEVAERYSNSHPESMSPAEPDAKPDTVFNLATALECDIRLAVYSLYHSDTFMDRTKALEQLLSCGKRSDSRD